MVDDRNRTIRDYVVLAPQAINAKIVRPEVQDNHFKLKLVMF